MLRRAFVRRILPPEIHPVHLAVCEPHRAVMRMIVLLVRRLLHGPRARHAPPARPDYRIVIDVRRIPVAELGEKFPAHFHAHAVGQSLHVHLRTGERSEGEEREDDEGAGDEKHGREIDGENVQHSTSNFQHSKAEISRRHHNRPHELPSSMLEVGSWTLNVHPPHPCDSSASP